MIQTTFHQVSTSMLATVIQKTVIQKAVVEKARMKVRMVIEPIREQMAPITITEDGSSAVYLSMKYVFLRLDFDVDRFKVCKEDTFVNYTSCSLTGKGRR